MSVPKLVRSSGRALSRRAGGQSLGATASVSGRSLHYLSGGSVALASWTPLGAAGPSTSRPVSSTSGGQACLARSLVTASTTTTSYSTRRRLSTVPPSETTFPASFAPFKSTAPSLVPASTGERIHPHDQPKYACERHSPLVCPNQLLIEELAVFYEHRRIGKDPNTLGQTHEFAIAHGHALAYERAISSIKAYPTALQTGTEAQSLPFVGPKIGTQIGEYLKTGKIGHAQKLRTDDRLRACLLFQTLHTVGPLTARVLYDDQGCRSLADVVRALPALAPQVEAWEDLQTSIPRGEVEEIAAVVAEAVEAVSPGCEFTICGGYRRGKPASGDVDVVFTHTTDPAAVSFAKLDAVVARLEAAGLVSASLAGGSVDKAGRLHQKYVVLRPPGEGRLKRRVDIIFARPEIYWTAVLGWTGSTSFERDLRDVVRPKGYKFDSSGIVGGRKRSLVQSDPAAGERGVFERLELDWVEPRLRNADV